MTASDIQQSVEVTVVSTEMGRVYKPFPRAIPYCVPSSATVSNSIGIRAIQGDEKYPQEKASSMDVPVHEA